MHRIIIDEQPINPKYYEKMSDLLDILIEERRANALAYEEYLSRVADLAVQVQMPTAGAAYPRALDSAAKRALYDNLGSDEALALALDAEIRCVKKDDWRGNAFKSREVRQAIGKHLGADIEAIFQLVKNQPEY